jgi:hypothetical protein
MTRFGPQLSQSSVIQCSASHLPVNLLSLRCEVLTLFVARCEAASQWIFAAGRPTGRRAQRRSISEKFGKGDMASMRRSSERTSR